MYEAYQIKSNIKSTNHEINPIESIAASGNTLLVGTKLGHLFQYNLEKSKINNNYELNLLRRNVSFSKKSIKQLDIIPEQHLLLSLTDNIVELHNINENFNIIETLQRTKGATIFAVNTLKIVSTTGDINYINCLAVVVTKKIQTYYLKNNRFEPLYDDIALTDIPKTMAWRKNVICIAFKDKYALLHIDGSQTDLFNTSNTRESCILPILDSHFLLTRDEQTILINPSGETNKLSTFKWPASPIYLAHDEPYTLGVLTDSILVCSLDPNKPIQALINLPTVKFLVQAKSGTLFAASLSEIWCLVAVDFAKQQEILVNAKEFELALKLIQISNDCVEEKEAKINNIRTLLAYELFAKKQFAESMREFLKLGTDPYHVIRLYPDMLPQAQQDEIPVDFKKLTDKEMQDSILALSDYLTTIRNKVSSESTKVRRPPHQLLQIIDTILVKCYLQTKDAMVGLILRQNNCNFFETERVLKKMERYNDLLILYETKGLHKKALELFQLEPSLKEDNVDRTVEYLQKLGPENIDVILEFSNWVLTLEPEKGLQIFTADLIEIESLPRQCILEFLTKDHPKLVIPYLEHVIKNWQEQNPLLHDELINQYLEAITKENSKNSQQKLLKFLEESTQYNPEKILKKIPKNCLFEEKALIFGRLGLHQQSIALYVRALGNVEMAENYCRQRYEKDDIGSQSVYVHLIKLLLNPEKHELEEIALSSKTAEPDIKRALEILKNNASKINPIEVLPELPSNILESEIHTFLTVALQKSINNRRQTELLKGLLYAQFLQCKERKMNLLNKRVVITELSVCPICKKRFANQTALIRYPNGDVVHFACYTEI